MGYNKNIDYKAMNLDIISKIKKKAKGKICGDCKYYGYYSCTYEFDNTNWAPEILRLNAVACRNWSPIVKKKNKSKRELLNVKKIKEQQSQIETPKKENDNTSS